MFLLHNMQKLNLRYKNCHQLELKKGQPGACSSRLRRVRGRVQPAWTSVTILASRKQAAYTFQLDPRCHTCRASWYTALSSESINLFSGFIRPCPSVPLTTLLLGLFAPNDEGSTLCEPEPPYTITSSKKFKQVKH
jgi:hypothetical protein